MLVIHFLGDSGVIPDEQRDVSAADLVRTGLAARLGRRAWVIPKRDIMPYFEDGDTPLVWPASDAWALGQQLRADVVLWLGTAPDSNGVRLMWKALCRRPDAGGHAPPDGFVVGGDVPAAARALVTRAAPGLRAGSLCSDPAPAG